MNGIVSLDSCSGVFACSGVLKESQTKANVEIANLFDWPTDLLSQKNKYLPALLSKLARVQASSR